jgi:hypothetical protein
MSKVKTIQDLNSESDVVEYKKSKIERVLKEADRAISLLNERLVEKTALVSISKEDYDHLFKIAEKLKDERNTIKAERDKLFLEQKEIKNQLELKKKAVMISEKQLTGDFKAITEEEAQKKGEEYIKKHLYKITQEKRSKLENMFM